MFLEHFNNLAISGHLQSTTLICRPISKIKLCLIFKILFKILKSGLPPVLNLENFLNPGLDPGFGIRLRLDRISEEATESLKINISEQV